MNKIKIFIADDHELVLEGLTSLIQGVEGFALAGRATTGEELVSALTLSKTLPDVCIVDIEMPGMGGIATLRHIKKKFPEVKVLILTLHEESFYINRVVKEGADGYLVKNLNRETFIQSIQKVVNGESFFVEGKTKPASQVSEHNGQADILTPREKLILRLIAQGKTNKQIAEELFISNRTVDTHRNNLMRKLNISSTVQLVHYAYSNNLL